MLQYLLFLSAAVAIVVKARSTGNVNLTRELIEKQWVLAASGVTNEDQDIPEGMVEQCIWFGIRPTRKRNVCKVNGEDHMIGSLEFVGRSEIAMDHTLAIGPVFEVWETSALLPAIQSLKCRDANTYKGKKLTFAISPIDSSLDHFLLVANSGGSKNFVLQTSIITKSFITLPKLKYLIAALNPINKETGVIKPPPMVAKCYKYE